MNVFDLFEYDNNPENEGVEKLRFHLKKNRFKSIAKPALHRGHRHGVDEQEVEETASMTKGMKSNHEAFKVQEARKPDVNFDIEDIKRLEQIKDLATLKTQAMALIAKPSAKPMRPEKVEWFRSSLEQMNSPMKVIKLMYDLMLSGEGHQVIGSRRSMNPNNYRSRFGEQGVAEGLNEFAPNGFNGGDDDEGFSPEIAKMAQEDGFTKGVSLADGATLAQAITINHWHNQHGGMYKQYFAKGFKAGRMNKIRHGNEQYNLNLKLMKDGSIRHGEQGVAEGADEGLSKYSTERLQAYVKKVSGGGVPAFGSGAKLKRVQAELKRREQGVAEGFRLRGTGNPGMPTPYDQGRADAKKGRPYDNPYDQPGEEQEHRNYRKGYEQGKQQGVAEGTPNFLDDDFYAYDPETMEIKSTWTYKDVGRRHSEYRAQQEGWKVVSGMRAKSLGLHYPTNNEAKQRLDPKCWTGYKKQGTKMKGGVRVNNCVPVEEENKGLYYNVNKRKKAGTSRDADHPKAPTAQAWKDAAKTAKKNESTIPHQMMEELEEYLFELELAGYEIINEKRTRP